MADEDKEKAEKVAAAKKRYEQLKKQKAKKAGGAKKKGEDKDKAGEASAPSTTAVTEPSAEDQEADEAKTDLQPEPIEATSATSPPPIDDDEPADLPKPKPHGRKPSVAVESQLRSASFYRGGGDGVTPTSPTAITPGGGVSGDIYREQAHRIDELERENKRLTGEVEDGERRWKKGEEELEELREGRGDVALAVERGKEADRLKAEVESLKRQVSHLQTQSSKTRRASTASPSQSSSVDDLNAQVASKSATIESLELEISSLNKQLAEQTNKTNSLQTRISTLESSLQKAEQEASSTKTELTDLKTNLEKASEAAQKEGSDRSSAETRIAQLEAELGAANRKASDSISRAELLDKKIETLTQLHRDNDTRNQARLQEHKKIEREATELRTRVTGLSNENARLRESEQRRRKADLGSIEDTSVQELVDEERDALLSQVRKLEEENFELKRGVWRDRRRDMQPGLDDEHEHAAFDDIDLSSAAPRPAQAARQGSSLQDVINSGISAFTGQPRLPPNRRQSSAHRRPREPSLGSLDDDFEIDEDAFRRAQEEEQRGRIERVREIKRGLENWRGWRADLVDVRAGWGGVFEI